MISSYVLYKIYRAEKVEMSPVTHGNDASRPLQGQAYYYTKTAVVVRPRASMGTLEGCVCLSMLRWDKGVEKNLDWHIL